MIISFATECQNYTSLDSADRKVTYNNRTVDLQSDDGLGPGWFRFEGAAGTRMASRCPYEKRCSARFPGWLKGGHPSFEDGQRKRKVCFRGNITCCSFPLPSKLGTVARSMCITLMVSLKESLNSATVAVIKHVNIPILRK